MTDIPAGAKKPQDHLAAKAEAEGTQFVTIDWRGHEFSIPASMEDASVDTLEAFENQKAVAAVRGILGVRQFDAFKAKHNPTVRDLNDLTGTIAKAMGLDGTGE